MVKRISSEAPHFAERRPHNPKVERNLFVTFGNYVDGRTVGHDFFVNFVQITHTRVAALQKTFSQHYTLYKSTRCHNIKMLTFLFGT
jgi:hypothetical protein